MLAVVGRLQLYGVDPEQGELPLATDVVTVEMSPIELIVPYLIVLRYVVQAPVVVLWAEQPPVLYKLYRQATKLWPILVSETPAISLQASRLPSAFILVNWVSLAIDVQ
jgi:hypothetical protein